jgi:hypothetical protein
MVRISKQAPAAATTRYDLGMASGVTSFPPINSSLTDPMATKWVDATASVSSTDAIPMARRVSSAKAAIEHRPPRHSEATTRSGS